MALGETILRWKREGKCEKRGTLLSCGCWPLVDWALSDSVPWCGLKWPPSFIVTALPQNALFYAFRASSSHLHPQEGEAWVQVTQLWESASLADGLRFLVFNQIGLAIAEQLGWGPV